ncbi:hypothetical protein [Mesorhizobium sp. CO1-1-8]|uniref:hypothetical protein n=1 Tax=Mesorhizobium sp. CO1-1-8 TaxID=2876631 RepID=UPI001CD0AD20|nr:hypothetical protein [Mesorhizobium sp. CO1-1-8]MBZ9777100.1 hypothetical protein [Mesorhizobium sp. CO1-1-8]
MLTFALAAIGSFLAFEWPPLLRRTVLTLLLAFIAVRVVRATARLLFGLAGAGNGTSDETLTATPVASETGQRFWLRRVSVIAGFLLFGWAVISLMPGIGFSIDVTRLVALLVAWACWPSPSKWSGGGRAAQRSLSSRAACPLRSSRGCRRHTSSSGSVQSLWPL